MIENEDVNLQSYVFAWTDCDWQGDLCQSGFPLSAQAGRGPPNLLKVQILFLKGARDQIGGNLFWSMLVFPARLDLCCQPEPFGENTVSGLRKAKKAKRPRPLPLWRMYTVFGSAYTDLGSLILDLGFQILKIEFQNLVLMFGWKSLSQASQLLPGSKRWLCWCRRAGRGVINLSTNFFNATSYLKRGKMLSLGDFCLLQYFKARLLAKIETLANSQELWDASSCQCCWWWMMNKVSPIQSS